MSVIDALVTVSSHERQSMSGALQYIFQIDFWVIVVAALGGAYLSLWDVKGAGLTDLSLSTAAVVIMMGVVLVSPAATLAGMWYVRERGMVQKDKK